MNRLLKLAELRNGKHFFFFQFRLKKRFDAFKRRSGSVRVRAGPCGSDCVGVCVPRVHVHCDFQRVSACFGVFRCGSVSSSVAALSCRRKRVGGGAARECVCSDRKCRSGVKVDV